LQARQIYHDAGATLGRAVADLVNVFSPQLVLISGEGTQAWTYLSEGFRQAYRENVFAPLRDLQVEGDTWDDANWAVGAAPRLLPVRFAAPLDDAVADSVRARLEAMTVFSEVVA